MGNGKGRNKLSNIFDLELHFEGKMHIYEKEEEDVAIDPN